MLDQIMGALGTEQAPEQMDPQLRRMLLARALGGGREQMPMPQMSPMGAAMTGLANGLNKGMRQDAMSRLFGGKRAETAQTFPPLKMPDPSTYGYF